MLVVTDYILYLRIKIITFTLYLYLF